MPRGFQKLNSIDLNTEPCDHNQLPIDLNTDPNPNPHVASFLPHYHNWRDNPNAESLESRSTIPINYDDNHSEAWRGNTKAEFLESTPTIPHNYVGVESADMLFGKQDGILGLNKMNNAFGFSLTHTGGFPDPLDSNSFKFAPETPDRLSKMLNHSNKESNKHENVAIYIENQCTGRLQNIVDLSAADSVPISPENKISDVGTGLGNINELKSTRKREHRPKVIKEEKPKKTQKTSPPKLNTPSQNPTGKRKYVDEAQQPSVMKKEKSCKRSLNFEPENGTRIVRDFDLNLEYQAPEEGDKDNGVPEIPSHSLQQIGTVSANKSTKKKTMEQSLSNQGGRDIIRQQKLKEVSGNDKDPSNKRKGMYKQKMAVSVDDIIYQLKGMRIDDPSALVPYEGRGQMIPYKAFDPKMYKSKVNLDPETDRVWKLLMGIQGTEATTDKNKEKYWENERQVFRGRADTFIALMHVVQGDRKFSQWKGSVLDSVIGVFLTQNVSDHLSSSAFMSLAAKFPLGSTNINQNGTTVPVNYQHFSNKQQLKRKFSTEQVLVQGQTNATGQKMTTERTNIKEQRDSPRGEEKTMSNARKEKAEGEKGKAFDWDSLRKQALFNGKRRERSQDTMDSLDYEAVRCADVEEISDPIIQRGMNNMLAKRIKAFLNRLVQDHGSIDLEWLRDVPPDKAKDYLLSVKGLGLKSAECVRLLTLNQLAFPVDTNVGRIVVRLGWVPLQPLPESLQLHGLELYPDLNTVQKYLWPRLCKLDQQTLYELHYQMITFGKVFCTKINPNCNACPMRGHCRHFASAFTSTRLSLPGPEERSKVRSVATIKSDRNPSFVIKHVPLALAGNNPNKGGKNDRRYEPVVEEPATPEEAEILASDIEDAFNKNTKKIPEIDLDVEGFILHIRSYMQDNMESQEADMSKAIVAMNPAAASIPVPKLKNANRLRTEHLVYELPDGHRLLNGLDKREHDDPSPYLLAIWTPGESTSLVQGPEKMCQTNGSANSRKEANAQTVKGTLLIPCRTAMRGSFPLNGTYFQVNEVFADHETSHNPIDVPRECIWNLPRPTVYFGTSVSTIFKGLTTAETQLCFWRGFVCVRGFERRTRSPRPLIKGFHSPPKKNEAKTKAKTPAGTQL